MKYIHPHDRKQISKVLLSISESIVALSKEIERTEDVINSNCSLGAIIARLEIQQKKINEAAEKQYLDKK